MIRLLLLILCLCRPCLASPNENSQEVSEQYDKWYLAGCIVTLVCAWEGLKTLVPKNAGIVPITSSSTSEHHTVPRMDTTVQVKKEVVSIGSQTKGSEDPQLDELLHTQTQQAQTIRACKALLGRTTMTSKP